MDSSRHQPPPFMWFSRQEYWSGLPFLSPGDLPDPGIEPRSPAWRADALPSEPPGKLSKYNISGWASLVDHTVKKLLAKASSFDPWVWKIPWRREWLPALVFLPGESHGQRSLVDYNPWGCKELDTTQWLSTHTETLIRLHTCIKLLILAVILWDRYCYFPF